MKPIIYNGYTIQIDQRNPYGQAEYMFYKTSEGVQHDADFDGGAYKYAGNCKWESTLQEAKDAIDEICWMSGLFLYTFETFTRGAYAINETFKSFGKNIDEAMENLEAMIGTKDYRLLSITK